MTESYGLTGVGMCHRCNSPEFLFVFSRFETPELCIRCLRTRFNDMEEVPVPKAEDFPFVSTVDTCVACLKPEYADEVRWALTDSRLADGSEIRVHRTCAMSEDCEDCGDSYASTQQRSWGTHMSFYLNESTVDTARFSSFNRVEGNWRCEMCCAIYYDSHGGEANFTYCENCENTVHDNNTSIYNGQRYCSDCVSDNVYDCDECGSDVWSGNSHYCEEVERNNIIHSYGYKPNPIFFGEGSYHMGFELEVEARSISRHEGAQIAQDILGNHAYMKSDGSLNDGFEIVTHPHTLEYYQKKFEWSVLRKLKSSGHRSWNTTTCGLHVHVSREAFGGRVEWDSNPQDIMHMQAHQLRFMKLIYDNERQVARIAGRPSNSYASFSDKGKLVPKVKHGQSRDGHCAAVNTENFATIEIRVFKGSLRKERILSALEFVTAGVEYTRDLKVTGNNTALSWLRFAAYVSNESVKYPNLALIMSESFTRDQDPSDDDN